MSSPCWCPSESSRTTGHELEKRSAGRDLGRWRRLGHRRRHGGGRVRLGNRGLRVLLRNPVAAGGGVVTVCGGTVTVLCGGVVTVFAGAVVVVVVTAGVLLSRCLPPNSVVPPLPDAELPATSSGTVNTTAAMTKPSRPVMIATRQLRARLRRCRGRRSRPAARRASPGPRDTAAPRTGAIGGDEVRGRPVAGSVRRRAERRLRGLRARGRRAADDPLHGDRPRNHRRRLREAPRG